MAWERSRNRCSGDREHRQGTRSGAFKDSSIFAACGQAHRQSAHRGGIDTRGAFDSLKTSRQPDASVDAALASADQQARAVNQNSLFGHDEADVALIVNMQTCPLALARTTRA